MSHDSIASLDTSGLRFVRVTFCDNANLIRAKAIHRDALPGCKYGVGFTAAAQSVPVMFDAVAPGSGAGPAGEVRLIPDWSTLTPLPYAHGHARVIGDLEQGDQPWSCCPRHFLRRQIELARQMGFTAHAAFENEFFLLKRTPTGIEPTDNSLFGCVQGMERGRVVIDDIADALNEQKIPIELYYPESGPGQHELSIRHSPPLEAADRQIVFRETVHAIAERHGLVASFLPKIFADKPGNGCHLHLSLYRDGVSAFADRDGLGGLSPTGLSFVAGLLAHLPALMAIVTPSTNSYRRIRPHFWSGAYRCWGIDNREAPVRVPTNPAGTGTEHIELKTCDASANPYLALGAVLAAGLDGVKRGLKPGEPVQADPGDWDDAERARRGIEPLPTSLSDSIEQLTRCQLLLEALGPELARCFLAVRRMEWETMKNFTLEEEIKLLLERY